MLIALQTNQGPAYVKLDSIEAVSTVFKKGSDELRQVTTGGGARIYILNSEANYQALRDLLPADAPALAKAAPRKPETPLGRLKRERQKPSAAL